MISTHILDTSKGEPASAVEVILEMKDSNGDFKVVDGGVTNSDGRYAFNDHQTAGVYRITFGIQNYYLSLKQESFFQDVQVSFEIKSTQRKYHVPLLLNPYGYSTYRGS